MKRPDVGLLQRRKFSKAVVAGLRQLREYQRRLRQPENVVG